MSKLINRINRQTYVLKDKTNHYQSKLLKVSETAALLKYQPAFTNRNILDLGVGTGRTTRYLYPLANSYLCCDYSPYMVAYMNEHFPDVKTLQVDMRDLTTIESSSIDFVLGASNVLDAVSHDDRLIVLSDVFRVLSTGGIFMFSSHNLGYKLSQTGPVLRYSKNPITQYYNFLSYVRSLINYRRNRRFWVLEKDYAVFSDRGHDYSLLHYYINRKSQKSQLHSTGFDLLEVFDENGKIANDEDQSIESSSLLYVARRT